MIACFPRVLTIQEGRLAIIIFIVGQTLLVPAPTQMLRTGVSRGNLQPCATFPRYQKYSTSSESENGRSRDNDDQLENIFNLL